MSAPLRFDGRVAIVTGAGRGVGREHALLLAARGAAVVVNDIGYAATGGGDGSAEPAERVVDEIRAAGGRAAASSDDVSTAAGCGRMAVLALERFGRIDALICNAGTNRPQPLAEMTEEDFDFLLRQHVHGTFHSVRAVWPQMVQQGGGRLVLTTSGASYFGLDQQLHYCAAKGAVHGMIRALAIEGRAPGIVVNGFWPSAFTRMVEVGEELKARMQRTMPARLAAQVAVWLAHERCPLAGEVLHGGSGRASRVFVAETRGYCDAELSLESLTENCRQVVDEEGYMVFADALESSVAQTRIVAEALGGQPAG